MKFTDEEMLVHNRKVITDLFEALKQNQWGFAHRRCSLCAGWNMSPYGETDYKHTATCPVKLALAQAEEYLNG